LAPKVSVCIPAFGAPEYFERTLATTLSQSYTDLEVVITDDTPGSEVAAIDADIADSRIVYVRNETTLGSPANWSAALNLARGEYVKVMHHDDWFTGNQSLHEFVGLLDAADDVNFGFSASVIADSQQRLVRVHRPAARIEQMRVAPTILLLGNWIGSPSATIFRREGSPAIDSRLRWVVDIDFYLAFLTKNPRFGYADAPLVATTSGASHQVTASVAHEPRTELFEWFTLFGKWASTIIPRGEVRQHLSQLQARCGVTSWHEYRGLGLDRRAAIAFVSAYLGSNLFQR
jgi:glycosyltransferase involved in cell wall biosynthesis